MIVCCDCFIELLTTHGVEDGRISRPFTDLRLNPRYTPWIVSKRVNLTRYNALS
jgi:hypothetical protein